MENAPYLKLKINEQQFCAIAKILKPFGIHGEVKIYSYARTAEEFSNLDRLFLGKDTFAVTETAIETVTVRGNEIFVKLKGVEDRTASEALGGKFLFVEESRRKELPEGSFFIDDLAGCKIVDEEHRELGVVQSVETIAGQQCYSVTTSRGEVLLPAVKEFILSVDIKKKIIIARPPEGLFDGEMA